MGTATGQRGTACHHQLLPRSCHSVQDSIPKPQLSPLHTAKISECHWNCQCAEGKQMKSPPPGHRRQRVGDLSPQTTPCALKFLFKEGKRKLCMKERAEAPHTREPAVINPGILQIPPATRQALFCLHIVLTPEPSRDLSITLFWRSWERKGEVMIPPRGSAHSHPGGNYSFDNR